MNDVCRTTILDYTILLLLVPFRADAALPIFQILYASVDIVRTLLLTWCYIAYGSTGTRVYVADRLPVSIVPAAPPRPRFFVRRASLALPVRIDVLRTVLRK